MEMWNKGENKVWFVNLSVYSLQFICYSQKYIFQTYLNDSTT